MSPSQQFLLFIVFTESTISSLFQTSSVSCLISLISLTQSSDVTCSVPSWDRLSASDMEKFCCFKQHNSQLMPKSSSCIPSLYFILLILFSNSDFNSTVFENLFLQKKILLSFVIKRINVYLKVKLVQECTVQ